MPEAKKPQLDRFKRAARDAGADMTKEDFGRVIGGLAKPKPEGPEHAGTGKEADE